MSDDYLESGYFELEHKVIPDSDGFFTDYTLYFDIDTGRYVCIFGDRDLYDPTNTEPDYECDDKDEAYEWFDSYTGFDDEDVNSSECINCSDGEETTASDIVRDMYRNFPEISFIDERDYDDERVVLKYRIPREFDKYSKLTAKLDSYGCSYQMNLNRINIFALEDYLEDDNDTSEYEKI